jgi:hypothetical protein
LPVFEKLIHKEPFDFVVNLLTSNQKQSGIHNSGSVQHSSHENVVTGTIDEAHMTNQLEATRA